jgi:hypothetical protein
MDVPHCSIPFAKKLIEKEQKNIYERKEHHVRHHTFA